MGNNKKKANLYNQAINIISKSPEDNSAKRRTAELHEKGGNLLSAAQIYEEIHDRKSKFLKTVNSMVRNE